MIKDNGLIEKSDISGFTNNYDLDKKYNNISNKSRIKK